MSKQYLRLTLLENMVLGMGVDWADKGAYRDWHILETMSGGWILCERNGDRIFITQEELEAGYKEVRPNWSIPTGMKFKVEPITKLSFWEKLLEALSSKLGLGGDKVPLPPLASDQQHKEKE